MTGIDTMNRSRKRLGRKASTILRIKKSCRKLIIRVLVYFFPPKKYQGHPIIGVKDGYQVTHEIYPLSSRFMFRLEKAIDRSVASVHAE